MSSPAIQLIMIVPKPPSSRIRGQCRARAAALTVSPGRPLSRNTSAASRARSRTAGCRRRGRTARRRDGLEEAAGAKLDVLDAVQHRVELGERERALVHVRCRRRAPQCRGRLDRLDAAAGSDVERAPDRPADREVGQRRRRTVDARDVIGTADPRRGRRRRGGRREGRGEPRRGASRPSSAARPSRARPSAPKPGSARSTLVGRRRARRSRTGGSAPRAPAARRRGAARAPRCRATSTRGRCRRREPSGPTPCVKSAASSAARNAATSAGDRQAGRAGPKPPPAASSARASPVFPRTSERPCRRRAAVRDACTASRSSRS